MTLVTYYFFSNSIKVTWPNEPFAKGFLFLQKFCGKFKMNKEIFVWKYPKETSISMFYNVELIYLMVIFEQKSAELGL